MIKVVLCESTSPEVQNRVCDGRSSVLKRLNDDGKTFRYRENHIVKEV